MNKNWFADAISGDFNKNVEVAQREYDGLFNLWRKVLSIEEDGSFTIFWEIVGVHPTKEAAEAQKASLKKVLPKDLHA
jgi:hypothetical protein